MRKPTDPVIFHRKERTVHEVRRSTGNTYCGNGNPGCRGAQNYQRMTRNQAALQAGAKPCDTCAVLAP